MCGFAGYINFDSETLDFNVLKKMTDIQSHRGPDDQGFIGFNIFDNPKAEPVLTPENYTGQFQGGIGFNRLSILDLSERGHQPMISACGKALIAYNGETYNAFDFKPELIKKGYQFKSNTDTEVLLNLYLEYGIKGMLERLNGMFAFTIVDLEKRKCFIARDHFGIKPLYVYQKNGSIMFASEIKSFTPHPKFKAEIDQEHLDEYLVFRYCANDRTLMQDVKQVPPSHYYEITSAGIDIKEYWTIKPEESKDYKFEEALTDLDRVFKNSIRSQLISDVKVGCQLSGGIDSSLVTTYAREFFKANMDTFSIVFKNEKYSEEKWINYVTNLTESDSHRFQYSSDYVYENIFKATWHLDQPISIPNALGIKRMAERSKENVTVLLSGEGADELFGGYSRYHDLSLRQNNKLQLLSKLPVLGDKLRNKYLLNDSPENFFILSSSALANFNPKLLRNNVNFERVIDRRLDLFPKGNDLIRNASIYDQRTYMVDLLNRQDKMTMAHSIENRVPFLDRKLVEFVYKLPSSFLVGNSPKISDISKPGNYTKHILKQLAAFKFNKDFVYRKKSGFPLPMEEIFLKTPMKEVIEDLLMPGIKNRGLFNYEEIQKIWKRKGSYSNSDLKNLWMFFSFEIWAQTFIDN